MPTQTPLIRYKKRLFVRLCNCNSSWSKDFIRFGTASGGGQSYYPQNAGICVKCGMFYRIILPKGESILDQDRHEKGVQYNEG